MDIELVCVKVHSVFKIPESDIIVCGVFLKAMPLRFVVPAFLDPFPYTEILFQVFLRVMRTVSMEQFVELPIFVLFSVIYCDLQMDVLQVI